MKWVALAFFLSIAIALVPWLRGNPRLAPVVWSLLTLLPFVMDPLNLIVSPYSIPMWSGYVKGWDVSLLDAVAFGVIFGTRGRWPRMALLIPFLAYAFAATIAVVQARFPNYAIAYSFQLLRVLLVFLAVARVAQLEAGQKALLTGLIVGIGVQAASAIWARAGGAFQTGGTLGHQNLLGFVSHMALMPLLGLFLAGRWPMRSLLGVAFGIIVVILTGSRATILLAAASLGLILVTSLLMQFNPRKMGFVIGGLIIVSISAPFAYSTIERRITGQASLTQKDSERLAFEQAARLIIAENSMGVGPNHYVFVSNTEGYADRAGVNWSYGNRSAIVHQAYLLVTAETGYLGLLTLVLLFSSAACYAFITAFQFRRHPLSNVLIGLGFAIVAISLHSFVEWMFVLYTSQYVLATNLGLIVGIRSYLKSGQIQKSRATRPRPQEFMVAAT